MTELEKYLEHKREAERQRRDADRLAGAYDQALADLKRELGVESLEEGEQELERLLAKSANANVKRDQKIEEFNRQVEGKL